LGDLIDLNDAAFAHDSSRQFMLGVVLYTPTIRQTCQLNDTYCSGADIDTQ
jgi:hypothetical protein